MERLMHQKLEQEREKRLAQIQQIGIRRLANMGLARGWSAWHEMFSEKLRKQQLLRVAVPVARL